jgi:hypothetical protein
VRIHVTIAALVCAGLAASTNADAQFRRGILGEGTEITLYPLDVPALLLPAGAVHVDVRNASSASARIVGRLQELMSKQIADNDSRLDVVEKDADVTVVATLVDWKESRRNSTKYVSETRQIGTREVRDKNGKTKTEPIYEYGRERPSVVIDATAGLRVEVRRRRGGASLADETVRHTIQEEHLVEAGPPSRDEVEDTLLDRVVQKGAARVSPGRLPARARLARSDDVERFNEMAQDRRWNDWLTALEGVTPRSDRKRDAYRLHNIAVAHEALAYEATDIEDWTTRLNLASKLIAQAASQNPGEKYFADTADRIGSSASRYYQLAGLYRDLGLTGMNASPRGSTPPPPPVHPPAAVPPAAGNQGPAAMTNADVIDLRASGLDDDNLVAAIAEAKVVRFDLTAPGLKTLLAAKISNRVIAAMRSRVK